MAGIYPFRNYRVFFTPLVSANVYGSTIDITQDVDLTDWIRDLGRIRKEIDNGDYDIGIYTFGDITLTAINFSRKFNDENDEISIFPFKRDLCKVEIEFYDDDGTSTTRFKGVINDDATRIDVENDRVRFKVLSQDSIFRQLAVPAGAIVTGDLFSTAIKKMLNIPSITSVLNYDASLILVDSDVVIDDGEYFSDLNIKQALDELLLASNSILFVDNTDYIRVQPRTESGNVFYLYGRGDPYGRDNILSIKNYNTGLHRAYSSVKVNDDTVKSSTAWISEYGFRQKSISLDFITTESKEQTIAENILDEFKVPKEELEVTVLTKDVLNIDLLDLVCIDYGYRVTPDGGNEHLPMYGQAEYGTAYYARTVGSVKIHPQNKWKVTQIDESAKDMTTTLRLRRAGKETHDGYFNPSLDFHISSNSMYLGLF